MINLDDIDWTQVVAIGETVERDSPSRGILVFNTGKKLELGNLIGEVREHWMRARAQRADPDYFLEESVSCPNCIRAYKERDQSRCVASQMALNASFLEADQIRLIRERDEAKERARNASKQHHADCLTGEDALVAKAKLADVEGRQARDLERLNGVTKERDEAEAKRAAAEKEIDRRLAVAVEQGDEIVRLKKKLEEATATVRRLSDTTWQSSLTTRLILGVHTIQGDREHAWCQGSSQEPRTIMDGKHASFGRCEHCGDIIRLERAPRGE